MAGTGHAYEIANIDSVHEYLTETCERLPEGPAKDWFLSRIVLKNITAPLFTIRLSPNTPTNAFPAMRPEEKPYLLKKIKEGRDVRLFSRQALANSGLDLSHAADWLASLDAEDPVLNKLQRMDPMTVLARADDWMADLNGDSETREGDIETVLKTRNGRTWVRLKDNNALRHEGARMNHCVGNKGYQECNASGACRIYSLRSPTGKPIVTAEYLPTRQTFRQVMRYGNRPIGHIDRRDLCDLADLIGDIAPSKTMEYAGLCLDAEGKWRAIEDFAETIMFLDFPALVRVELFQSKLFLLSPRNTGATMAVFYSLTPSWWKEEDPTRPIKDRISVNMNVDGTQINHIDEQRQLADFVNALNAAGFNVSTPSFHYFGDTDLRPFTNRESKLVPMVDTFDVITGNEIDYLRHENTYFLQAPGNKARTLATARPDCSEGLSAETETLRLKYTDHNVRLKKDIDPTPSTLRRLARFMNSLRSDAGLLFVKLDSEHSKKVCNVPGLGFVYVPDYTVTEKTEDGSGIWYRTPWSSALAMESRLSKKGKINMLSVNFDSHDDTANERTIRGISIMLATSDAVDLFCEELNARKAIPSMKFYKNMSLEHWLSPKPIYVRGKWSRFQGVDWYLKLMKGKARTLRLKPLDAEAALYALSNQPHPLREGQSELLKSALLCWASKVNIRGPQAETFPYSNCLFEAYGRVLALIPFYERGDLTEKETKAVKRIAEACVGYQFRRGSRSRHPLEDEERTRILFRAFFDLLSDKLIIRYARRLHRANSFNFFKEQYRDKQLDPVWIDRLKSAVGHVHERHLKNSAVSTIWDLGYVIGTPSPKTVESWLELFGIVIDMKLADSYFFQRGAERILEFLSEKSETSDEWRNLNDRRGFIEEALREKARRAEERQREFTAKFRNSRASAEAKTA
ncbi:PcfJ domain-containing protein [Roseibium sp. RKSG952]|uniref:PcfJ domain-containing protein n=1 Tax=Roseibium sp. RKSG952 TaxID=2529384 RepID=UPI0012BD4E02|nr:PcfJ domain-containing protein [Roseibium sp. RKSG952]MTH95469.1 hypothetical protein [Roseibium sp. RKSG952]